VTGAARYRPHHQNEGIDGEIYIKIVRGSQDYVHICGYHSESLKHTVFYMDLHAAEDESKDLSNYSFENRNKNESNIPLVQWTDRRYVGNECTTLYNIPTGKHILGIQRNTTIKSDHINSVVNIITW